MAFSRKCLRREVAGAQQEQRASATPSAGWTCCRPPTRRTLDRLDRTLCRQHRHCVDARAQLRRSRRDRGRGREARRARRGAASSCRDDIDEDAFRGALYDPALPDPDLLIRTSGEMRVSNFLLWQIAYSRDLGHRRAVARLHRGGPPGRGPRLS